MDKGNLFKTGLIKYAIIAFVFLLTGCSVKNRDYVMTIGSEKITVGEFMVYLMEQKKSFEGEGGEDIWDIDFDGVNAEDVAKNQAADTIVMVKAAVSQADKLKVEKKIDAASVKSESAGLLDEISNELGSDTLKKLNIDESLIKKIVSEAQVHQRVFDYVTEGFQVSDADFDAYVNDYYEKNKYKYISVTAEEIYVSEESGGKEKINLAYDLLVNGDGFDQVREDYSNGERQGSFELDLSALSEETLKEIYGSESGDYVLAYEPDGYYIYLIESIKEIPIEEIKDDVKVDYIKEKKQEIYQTQSSKWIADTAVSKNNEVWDKIGFDGYDG